MKKAQVFYWRVTLRQQGRTNAVTVQPIAADKLQASHRAAHMLGVEWRSNARHMEIAGPYKALAEQIRQWNRTYPQWSTERVAQKHSGLEG